MRSSRAVVGERISQHQSGMIESGLSSGSSGTRSTRVAREIRDREAGPREANFGLGEDPPAGAAALHVKAAEPSDEVLGGAAVRAPGARHGAQNAGLKDLPGDTLGQALNLPVELLEALAVKRGLAHGASLA